MSEAEETIASMLHSEAMVRNVAEAMSREQSIARVEHRRRLGYAARVSLARLMLDEVCRGLGLPDSLDAMLAPTRSSQDAADDAGRRA